MITSADMTHIPCQIIHFYFFNIGSRIKECNIWQSSRPFNCWASLCNELESHVSGISDHLLEHSLCIRSDKYRNEIISRKIQISGTRGKGRFIKKMIRVMVLHHLTKWNLPIWIVYTQFELKQGRLYLKRSRTCPYFFNVY